MCMSGRVPCVQTAKTTCQAKETLATNGKRFHGPPLFILSAPWKWTSLQGLTFTEKAHCHAYLRTSARFDVASLRTSLRSSHRYHSPSQKISVARDVVLPLDYDRIGWIYECSIEDPTDNPNDFNYFSRPTKSMVSYFFVVQCQHNRWKNHIVPNTYRTVIRVWITWNYNPIKQVRFHSNRLLIAKRKFRFTLKI